MVTEKPIDSTEKEIKLNRIYNRYDAAIKTPPRETKYICTRCHQLRQRELYYRSANPLMYFKRVGICAVCIGQIVKFENEEEAEYFLSLLHYPFFLPLWMQAIQKPQPIKYYIDMVVSSEYSSLRVLSTEEIIAGKSSSDKPDDGEKLATENISRIPKIAKEKLLDLQRRWGDNYNTLEYLKLEEYYDAMMKDYEIRTTAHKDYLVKITKASHAMDQALASGDYATYKNLSGIFDTLMKSANLADAKSKENRREGSYNAFGLLFETVEKRGFIPKYHDVEDPDIVDKTIKNLKSWTKQMIQGDADLSSLLESAAQRLVDEQRTQLKNNDDYAGISGLEDVYDDDKED